MEELPIWKRELPATPHSLLDKLVTVLVEFYGEHLRRDRRDGRLQPGEAWDLLRGFLIAAMQTYASICILLAEKRPKRLMLQANVLNRALFEILATVFAILEDPGPRAQLLLRESHKAEAKRYDYLNSRWGGDPQWAEYLDVCKKGLLIIGKEIGLAPADALRPDAIADQWPTPGVMIYGRRGNGVGPFISGTRLDVLRETYRYHYAHQSAQAHGRIAALAVALLVDDPDSQWNRGHGESNIVLTALLFLACILSELEIAGGYQRHPKLAELWTYLRDMNGEATALWTMRYEALLAPRI